MLLVLTLMVDTTAARVMSNVAECPAELAFRIAFCADPTAQILAVNWKDLDPAPTLTLAGTVTLVLLLERLTFSPLLGASAFSTTLHVSFMIPLTDALPHERYEIVAVCAFAKEAKLPSSTSAKQEVKKGERELT